MSRVGVYIAVILASIIAAIAVSIAAVLWVFFQWKLKSSNEDNNKILKSKFEDVELQKLNLSIRTTSDKKVSFEEPPPSQGAFIDGSHLTTDITPRKMTLELYTVEDLKRATEDFDTHNHIEGTAYRGRLKGKDIAIKRTPSESILKVDYGLFQDPVHNHHYHPNIIRLLGTSLADDINHHNNRKSDSFLVFEYAKNGSLKDWIHSGLAVKSHFISSCYCFLSWSQRLKICLGIASALQYMHQVMNPSYIHRNIKSRNVFLDEEFNAKIGNFGMARCVVDDADDPIKKVRFCPSDPGSWNRGYLAPELVKGGAVSPSVDVYAFGVVLLEILSGKPPILSSIDNGEEVECLLSEKIKKVVLDDSGKELGEIRVWIDSALGENYDLDEAIQLANLARCCVEEEPSLRPTAGEIMEKLSRLVVKSRERRVDDECLIDDESSSKPLVQSAVMSSGVMATI